MNVRVSAAARWAAAIVLCWSAPCAADDLEPGSQLSIVRSKIGQLEKQLTSLEKETTDVRQERVRLDAELALAEARVDEIELMLRQSRDVVVALRAETDVLAERLEVKKVALSRHLEMLVLLGKPGPLQLMYDAVRGGDLEQATDLVAVLTSAQVQLIEEYDALKRERTTQLAMLSRRMNVARDEAEELVDRRKELEEVRGTVEKRLRRLEKKQRSTGDRLAEMKSRAEALERLLTVVRSRQSFEGREDIRRYRGALPWPADGEIVRTFGKHYLPKYATYTVCNGLRLDVSSQTEVKAVFPGQVAYAQHFKGYGNMVVIDHGNTVYSLVAGLATIHVKVGQSVDFGKRLGLASPPEEGGNLYFEIRVGEKPQDPKRWIQLKEGHS